VNATEIWKRTTTPKTNKQTNKQTKAKAKEKKIKTNETRVGIKMAAVPVRV